MKKWIRVWMTAMILLVLSVFCNRVNAESKTTFTVDHFSYTILNNSEKTICLTGFEGEITEDTIKIPQTVKYGNETYTVKAVDYDGKNESIQGVKNIVVPESVTEGFVIKNSVVKKGQCMDDTGSLYNAPFPALTEITFLGAEVPKQLSVFTYLPGCSLIYHVPDGSEAAYEKVVTSNQQLVYDCFDPLDGDHTYKGIDIKPVVISNRQPQKESELFSTEYGIYLVTKSAENGQGEVTLLKQYTFVPVHHYDYWPTYGHDYPYWGEYTLESQVSYRNYHYTVTKLAKTSLADLNVAVLAIPDTITQMESYCIDARNLKAVFFSENCSTIPSKVFITGESDETVALICVPNSVATIHEGAFSGVESEYLVVPKNVKHSKTEYKQCKKVTETVKLSKGNQAEELSVPKQIVTAKITQKASLNVKQENAKSKEKLQYLSLDNGVAIVNQTGVVTPKHNGNDYILAYTTVTGKHSLIKVNVKDKIFSNGIYTYRMNYDTKPTVTIIGCMPKSSTIKLVLPSTVTYNKKKYTVTQVVAGESILNVYDASRYTVAKGYPRTFEYKAQLIPDVIAQKSKITEIVIPATVKLQVSYFGKLPELKIIRFQGTTPPSLISMPAEILSKVKMYIPKRALASYKKTHWRYYTSEDESAEYDRWEKNCKFILKTY